MIFKISYVYFYDIQTIFKLNHIFSVQKFIKYSYSYCKSKIFNFFYLTFFNVLVIKGGTIMRMKKFQKSHIIHLLKRCKMKLL